MTSSLEVTDQESAAVATHPRVTLANIQNAIAHTAFSTGHDLTDGVGLSEEQRQQIGVLTICLVVMKNGFSVIGKAAPASPENFNAELGRKFAYEDAVRQLWPLMGFALREKLHDGKA